MLLVSAVVCAIVAGHLFDAWRQDDHWPFAAYPMFARVNKPEPFTSEQIWGVKPNGSEVLVSSEMTGVMGINRVRPSLMGLYLYSKRPKSPHPEAAERALNALLKDYEKRRQHGQTRWPRLIGMKFVQLRWEFDWWAKNRDNPQRTVLVETRLPATQPTAPATAPSTQRGNS
jgi:hypothetical protein